MQKKNDTHIGVGTSVRDVLNTYQSAAWLLSWYGVVLEEEELDQSLIAVCHRYNLDYWTFTADLIDPGDLPDDDETEEMRDEEPPPALTPPASSAGGSLRR